MLLDSLPCWHWRLTAIATFASFEITSYMNWHSCVERLEFACIKSTSVSHDDDFKADAAYGSGKGTEA